MRIFSSSVTQLETNQLAATKRLSKRICILLGLCVILLSPFFNFHITMKVSYTELMNKHIVGNTTSYDKKDRTLLGCGEIANLKVLREIGKGKQKVTYKVKLPWGEYAAVKRCLSQSCIAHKYLRKESKLIQEVHEQYGDQSVRYFGECNTAYNHTGKKGLNRDLQDFSIGFTSVVELGKPLLTKWSDMFPKCFAEFYTETDIEDFRNIARLFANLSKSPMMLKVGEHIDNIFPQQYITRIGGPREGRIKLADFDMLETCTIGEKIKNGENCTFDTALKANCEIMAKLTNIANLNCSLSSSRTKLIPHFPNDHINVSHAVMECRRKECRGISC